MVHVKDIHFLFKRADLDKFNAITLIRIFRFLSFVTGMWHDFIFGMQLLPWWVVPQCDIFSDLHRTPNLQGSTVVGSYQSAPFLSFDPFLAHLDRRSMWAIVITMRPSSSSSPGPKGHVSYCYPLASVVVVVVVCRRRRKLFQKSSSQKLQMLQTWNFRRVIYRVSRL